MATACLWARALKDEDEDEGGCIEEQVEEEEEEEGMRPLLGLLVSLGGSRTSEEVKGGVGEDG